MKQTRSESTITTKKTQKGDSTGNGSQKNKH